MSLGAMANNSQISSNERLSRSRLPALAEAASRVGCIHVQNLGTVGGNLSHAEPNGDSAPALICLGGFVVASSHRGERTIPLADFFRGPFENSLEPDELVARVHVPLPIESASSVYVKHVQRAVDRATVGIGVQFMERSRRRLHRCSHQCGGSRPLPPFRATSAETVLEGKKISDALLDAVAAELSSMCDPLADRSGPAEWERTIWRVCSQRERSARCSRRKGVERIVADLECEIRVNGKLCKVDIDPSTLLLDLLREKLGLTGAKRGCSAQATAAVARGRWMGKRFIPARFWRCAPKSMRS